MTHMTLQAVRQLIANDSYAISFQSVEQYRATLLRHVDSLTELPTPYHELSDLEVLVREYGNTPLLGDGRTRKTVMADIYSMFARRAQPEGEAPQAVPVFQVWSKADGGWHDRSEQAYAATDPKQRRMLYTAPAAQHAESGAPAPDAERVDAIVTGLYRRFKDWSKRGFGPDDVTWCEVKADAIALIAAGAAESGAQAMRECPECDGAGRISPVELCTRCDHSGVLPALSAQSQGAQAAASGLTRYSMWSNSTACGMDPSPSGDWVSFDEVRDLLAAQVQGVKADKLEFWQWLPNAYHNGDQGNEARFTKYNMEVAYEAGRSAAQQAAASGALEADDRAKWTTKQWYEHVGAWETPEGHISFGSVMALGAMLIQFQRAHRLAAPSAPGTPEAPKGGA